MVLLLYQRQIIRLPRKVSRLNIVYSWYVILRVMFSAFSAVRNDASVKIINAFAISPVFVRCLTANEKLLIRISRCGSS